jgi:glucan biosynthesis protein C
MQTHILTNTVGNQPINVVPDVRSHGLDAARAIALLIGIFHHGIESFVSYVNGDWVTQDSQNSILLDILFYASHVFRMQAFFLMSGYFAHLLFTRKGWYAFMMNRAKRLLLPFVIFWPLLYFSTLNLWIAGIQYHHQLPYDEAFKMLPTYMVWSHGFPLMHLWFLYFLILFCAGIILLRPVFVHWIDRKNLIRRKCDHVLRRIGTKWWGGILLGCGMIPPMLGMTDWFGVDTSASGLFPRIAPFVVYGMYFILGWFTYRQPFILQHIQKYRAHNFVFSVALIILLIAINLIFADPSPGNAALMLMLLNSLYAIASMTTVFTFLGYMLQWFAKENKTVRYLSESSYWGYLIHVPILACFQILVANHDLFWGAKLLIIFIPSLAIIILSYHFLVRKTRIGLLLNGKLGVNSISDMRKARLPFAKKPKSL